MNFTETMCSKICVLLHENLYISKVTRPLIESHVTAVVIPPELHTSKTAIAAGSFFVTLISCLFNLLIKYITIITVNRSVLFQL